MNEYTVIVTFRSELPIDCPAQYVQEAVETMKGCMDPDCGEFSIDPQSVIALELVDVPRIIRDAKEIQEIEDAETQDDEQVIPSLDSEANDPDAHWAQGDDTDWRDG